MCVCCQGRYIRYDNFSLLPFLRNSGNDEPVVPGYDAVHSDFWLLRNVGIRLTIAAVFYLRRADFLRPLRKSENLKLRNVRVS
jgi:hypothetical protein